MRTSPSRRSAASSGARRILALLVPAALLAAPALAQGQVLSQRGFIEGSVRLFPQEAPNDPTRAVGELLVRDEVFLKPAPWVQFAAGLDLRANSHDQIDDRWSLDVLDRGVLRPRLSIRRLTATLTRGPVTLDLGKQFVRWGVADIVNPTDRLAPRDFMNVIDAEFLGITAARGTVHGRGHIIEAVWTPRFTASRSPLLAQRWTAVPPDARGLPIVPVPVSRSARSQVGLRWGHTTGSVEYSLSAFDGFNHLPDVQPVVTFSPGPPPRPTAVEITSVYPRIRTYGGDLAWPTRWFTIKTEAAYFTSPAATSDEYGLYVVQLERQSGEWLFVGGYAGEVTSRKVAATTFAPDRGTSRSILARASRTIDVNSSFAFEGAVRQNGRGTYIKGEYSRAHGQHWRTTLTGVVLGGHSDDFFGQYHRNSHLKTTLRLSF